MSHKEKVTSARCPLRVEQNITIRVAHVDWTDNGIQTVVTTAAVTSNKTTTATAVVSSSAVGDTEPPNASKTVLQWGGGYATDKEVKRQWKYTDCTAFNFSTIANHVQIYGLACASILRSCPSSSRAPSNRSCCCLIKRSTCSLKSIASLRMSLRNVAWSLRNEA